MFRRWGDLFQFSEEEYELIGIKDTVNMLSDYLVEEYMEGQEINIDAIVQDGRVNILSISEEHWSPLPYFIPVYEHLPFSKIKREKYQIDDLVQKIVEAVGVKNSAINMEIIITKDGPRIVEIGCRMGCDMVTWIDYLTGYNFFYEWIKICLGEKR